jgi:hypothetical protein
MWSLSRQRRHEALVRIRPKKTPTLSAWLAYYQHSAAFHAELAGIDRGHHHEIPVLG